MKSPSITAFQTGSTPEKTLSILYARHSHELNPWFYSREKVVKIAGNVFGLLSLVSGFRCFHASVWLTDLPSVIKKTVFGYSLLTAGFIAFSFFCMKKKTFWNDPAFIAKRGVEAALYIRENKLGYLAIQQKYGQEINRFKILLKNDLIDLLKDEISHVSNYTQFIKRNGNSALYLFPPKELRELFQKECQRLKCATKFFLSSFIEEKKYFQISDETLLGWVLNAQINDVLMMEEDYFTFREKHPEIKFLRLSEDQKLRLKKIFLCECGNSEQALIKILETYKKDIEFFDIAREEIAKVILPRDAKNPAISYATFKERIGEESIDRVLIINSSLKFILKEKFLKSPYSFMISHSAMEDYFAIGITDVQEIFDVIKSDISKLSYDDLIRKHTPSFFNDWVFTGEEAEQVKSKLLAKIEKKGEGLLSINALYQTEISKLGISKSELSKIILPGEVRKCKSFEEFEKRNGSQAHLDLLNVSKDFKAELQELFFKEMTPHQFLSEKYINVGNEIGLKIEDIHKFVELKCNEQPYLELRPLLNHKFNLSDRIKARLQEKLHDFILACDIEMIKALKNDSIFFNIPLAQLYIERWKAMSMIKILTTEFEAFKTQITLLGQAALDWASQKTIKEIEKEGFSFQEILMNYSSCFSLNILTKNSKINDKEIYAMANIAIEKAESFEIICSNYHESIFVLATNVKSKINFYLRENSKRILKGEDHLYNSIIKEHKLISDYQGCDILRFQDKYKDICEANTERILQTNSLHLDFCLRKKMDLTSQLNKAKIMINQEKLEFDKCHKEHNSLIAKMESQEKELTLLEEFVKNNSKTEKELEKELQEVKAKKEEIIKPVPVQGIIEALNQPKETKEILDKLNTSQKKIEEDLSKLKKANDLSLLKDNVQILRKKFEPLKLKKKEEEYEQAYSQYQLVEKNIIDKLIWLDQKLAKDLSKDKEIFYEAQLKLQKEFCNHFAN